jgi:hypothetical protein
MPTPSVDDVRLDGTPLERVMLGVGKDGITVGKSDPSISTESIHGRNGVLDVTLEDETGAAYSGMRTITASLYTAGGEDDIFAAKSWLGALNGKTTTLSWRGMPGEWRGRLSVGEWSDIVTHDGMLQVSTVEVSMSAMPCLYAPTRKAALRNGANRINVRGNRPAWPTFTLTPTNEAKSVRVEDGHGHAIELVATGQTLTGSITISTDPDSRECRINGNLKAPTLESDYFPLLPGLQSLTLANCSGSLEYEPLTLI